MKLNRVPARTGLLWVKLGIQTFLRQPLALAGLFFMFMLAVSVLTLVPLVGAAMALALLPAATLGLMAATREVTTGSFPMPAVLASAFRAGRERVRSMLVLGGLYAIGSLLIMPLAAVIAGDPSGALQQGTEITEEALREPAIVRNLVVNMVLYVPLGLLFWHAPALVHWHGVTPVKSLFFSVLACWANKGAMLVYFIAWSAVFMLIALAVVTLASALGGVQLLSVLMFPMAMLMSAMFFTSVYFTFRDSFVTDDGQTPA
jgi:hypothetical protein